MMMMVMMMMMMVMMMIVFTDRIFKISLSTKGTTIIYAMMMMMMMRIPITYTCYTNASNTMLPTSINTHFH